MRRPDWKFIFPTICILLGLSGCAVQPPQPAQIDRVSPEQLAALVQAPTASLTLEQVVALSQQGNTDAEVIRAIEQSQSRYSLTPSQVLDWHQKGISKGVLDYMQQADALARQNAMADEINKREQVRADNEQKLKRERDAARLRSMDPWFYGPGWGYRPYWGGYGWRYW